MTDERDGEAALGELTSFFDVFVLSRDVAALIADHMGDHGVRPHDYAMLSAIDAHTDCTASILAERMAMPLTTVSDWAHTAAAKGWIAVAPGLADRRTRVLTLTDQGVRDATSARAAFGAAFEAYRAAATVPEREVHRVLAAMGAAVRQARTTGPSTPT